MTEQFACQSYSDDDGILKDCTCGKCWNPIPNTPDAEEKCCEYCPHLCTCKCNKPPHYPHEKQCPMLKKHTESKVTAPDTEWEVTLAPEGTPLAIFQKERTDAISEMFDNEDEYGIFPTGKFFARLDKCFENLISSRDTYWEWEVEKAKKEQRERDAYLIRTSGWHTAEKLARKIFGGKQVNWYTDKQMEGAREQVREERDTHWKERVQKEVEGMKVWFMEEDYCNTFPLISKEDLLDNLK